MLKIQGDGYGLKDYFDLVLDIREKILPIKGAQLAPNPQVDHRLNILRPWEIYAVFKNACFTKEDNVLEFGAWPTFAGIHTSHYTKSIALLDNFQFYHGGIGLDNLHPATWIAEINRYKRDNVQCITADITETRLPENTYDKIISYGVLEHVKDDLKALHEIARILKNEGLVCMTIDFNLGSEKPYDSKKMGRCYSKTSLQKLIDKSPFDFAYDHFDWKCGLPPDVVFALAITLVKRKIKYQGVTK